MRYESREQEERVDTAVQNLLNAAMPGREAIFQALVDFAGFVPEYGWQNIKKRGNYFYSKGDEQAPLISEGFTYWLIGKEDGRTMLALFSALCRACAFEMYEIQEAVQKKREEEERQRRQNRARNTLIGLRRAVFKAFTEKRITFQEAVTQLRDAHAQSGVDWEFNEEKAKEDLNRELARPRKYS